jgi:hypothetical protein
VLLSQRFHGQRQRGLYRLDFKFGSPLKRLATLLLQQTTNESDAQICTPVSKYSNSGEVLQLARFWLSNCTQKHSNCPNEDFYTQKPFYPTRLIKLLDNEEEVQLVSQDTLVCKSLFTFELKYQLGCDMIHDLSLCCLSKMYRISSP